MFILLPFLWLIVWLVIGGAVAAFSGLAPQGGGLMLFLTIFLGGFFGFPIVGGVCVGGWAPLGQSP